MNTHSHRLAGAAIVALFGAAAVAMAQTPPPRQTAPPTTPSSPQQPATSMPARRQVPQRQTATGQPPASQSMQFEQGTESSVTFPMQSGNGTVTVHAGMPAQVRQYGPPPSFGALDTNHDNHISQTEARAYPPLDSDFLYASGGRNSISRAHYANWVEAEH
ncbi:MAG TPA: hypothetical protein VFW60_08375 [Rhodanobacteraceae bacterium]|nr:hypothetical protein [Rhodanobacteraceae bacterium]